MSAEAVRSVTPEEYLAAERRAELKSEYLDGRVISMAGASRDHVLITGNVQALLRDQFRPRGCRVYANDLRVGTGKLYAYPDVLAVCEDERWLDGESDTLLNPLLIIEVLSPTTEDLDRGRKFLHYRAIETLREYVLVAQEEPRVERFSREPDGTWNYAVTRGLEQTVRLRGVACELALADVYAQTRAAGEAN